MRRTSLLLGHYMGRGRNIIKIDVSFNGDATMDATIDVISQTKIDCSSENRHPQRWQGSHEAHHQCTVADGTPLRAEAQPLDRKEIAILKKQAHDRKQASLVQLKTLKLIPDDAKKAINAFSRTPMIVWL